MYQRSIMGYNHHVPVITPLIVQQQGSVYSTSWPGEENYKRNEKIRRKNYVESVFLNQNVLDMGKREEDQENDDNSGSTEEARYVLKKIYIKRDFIFEILKLILYRFKNIKIHIS